VVRSKRQNLGADWGHCQGGCLSGLRYHQGRYYPIWCRRPQWSWTSWSLPTVLARISHKMRTTMKTETVRRPRRISVSCNYKSNVLIYLFNRTQDIIQLFSLYSHSQRVSCDLCTYPRTLVYSQ
jgi:hypothetical protein